MKTVLKKAFLNRPPTALKHFGANIFVKIPLFSAKKYRALYINKKLFLKYFDDKDTSFQHMADVIQDLFSTTLDPENARHSTPVGDALVDLQYDPLEIALSGNLGSGRAFYQDGIFNIKGEKTPLAISEKPEYSNGVLELEKSIYETVASNSLYGDTNIKLAPVLAILDINEVCQVPWKPGKCRRAKIIRIDSDGALCRVTHAFQAGKKFTQKQLQKFAAAAGAMEGEKFIQRILHGAWSAGNISMLGHMIDFDTVCAVKYRSPQYSYCKWYIENYFGYEYMGQLKILESMMTDPDTELFQLMISSREQYIIENFPRLMGAGRPSKDSKFRSVALDFIRLSQKFYPIFDDLSVKNPGAFLIGPFDFSKFFRIYPILKNRGKFNVSDCIRLLMDSFRSFDEFDLEKFDRTSVENEFYYTHVLHGLDTNVVHNLDQLLQQAKECVEFIKRYDELFSRITMDAFVMEKNAYIFNEDRDNLTMIKSIAGPIDDCKYDMSPEQIHRTIDDIIWSNHRVGNTADIRIFKNMTFFVRLDNKGRHKLCIKLYDFIGSGKSFIMINDKKYNAKIRQHKDSITLESPYFDNLSLLSYREIVFFYNDKKIKADNFIFSFTKEKSVSNFASVL